MKKEVSLLLVLTLLFSTIFSSFIYATPTNDSLDEYDTLRVKWQNLANGGDYDETDPNMKVLLSSINNVAQDLLDRMNPNPTPDWGANDYLWPEYILGLRKSAYDDSNNTQFSLRSIKNMAMAYNTVGCDLYGNEQLKDETLRALDYIYTYHFKPGVDSNRYGNWFTWEIGGPIYLCESIFYMFDHLTEQQIQDYAAIARKGVKETVDTGANALWRNRVRMMTAILLKNNADLVKVKNAVPGHMSYTTAGDGYHADGTFIQHNSKVYNGGYGKEAISDIAHFLYLLDDSPWEITDARKENIYTFVYNHYAPFMYKGVFMDMTRGREISRKDTTDAYAGITISLAVALVSEFAPQSDSQNFKGMIKDWMNNEFAMQSLGEGAGVAWYMFPVYNFSKVLEILGDETIEPFEIKESRQFGTGVRTVHSTDKFTLGLAMYNSKNIANNETGDSNTRGWYTGTGTYWIYTPDIGQFTTSKPTMNWYRFPGTTVVNNYKAGFAYNPNKFAGGTTLDKKYSVSGLEIGLGHVQVHANKSWFMFDDEVVALGSDIYSNHANTIETIIDQHRIENNNDLIINGVKKPDTLGWSEVINDAKWALLEGNVEGSNIGVYFPTPQKLTAIRQSQEGRWTDHGTYNVDSTLYSDDYITLLLDHGEKPTDESYSYVLLPGATAEEVEAYADDSAIEILRQDKDIHAVYHKNLNIVGANFFKDGEQSINAMGESEYIKVDKASSIMVSEDNEALKIAVTDTTQSNSGYINLEIDRSTEGLLTRDPRVEVIQYSPTVKLKIDVKNSNGSPIETTLSFLIPPAPNSSAIQDITLIDDTLTLNFESSDRADGYSLHYGTESGQYSNELLVSVPTAKIIGLDANTTYYFAVKAFNKGGSSEFSDEITYTIGNIRTLIDNFDDFSKITSYSSGWAFDNTNSAQHFEGDTSRLKRDDSIKTNRPEEITYFVPHPEDFELIAYDYGVSAEGSSRDTLLEIFGSSDNINWTLIPTEKTGAGFGINSWRKAIFKNAGELDEDIKFIKIIVSRNEKIWAPQLSKITINYAYIPDRMLIDTMQDDVRIFESSGDFHYIDVSKNDWNGNTHALYKNTDIPTTLTYSVTQMQQAELSFIMPDTSEKPIVSYRTSEDGLIYQPSSAIPENDFTAIILSDGSVLYGASLNLSGESPTFIEFSFGNKIIYITNITIKYNHIIAPISKIKYVDSESIVVKDYTESPKLKIAPMNGYGEIAYASSNKAIVSVDENGDLTTNTIGIATIYANIFGSERKVSILARAFTNPAKSKPASASSATAGYSAASAVDGNYTTRWQSSGGGAQWFRVDLGAKTEFNGIDILWQQYATKYTIQGSNDNVNWDDLYAEDSGVGGLKRIFFDNTHSYQYVRMHATEGPGLYSFFEFRVLSNKPPAVLVDLALNKTATSNGGDPNNASLRDPQLSVDGNDDTRWASARNDDQWFTVDLGAVYPVHEIRILWEGAAGKEYKIQVSDVNDDWANSNTIIHETANTGAGWKNYLLPTSQNGRFIRMQGITRTSTYGYSMYTFQVLGEKTEIVDEVAFLNLESNGVENLEDTTELTFTLDKIIDDLSVSNLILTGAKIGTLDSSLAPIYKLTISDIGAEAVNLSISKDGFRFTPNNKNVSVHKMTEQFELLFKNNDNYITSKDYGNISLEANINGRAEAEIELYVTIAVYKNGALIDIRSEKKLVETQPGSFTSIETSSISVSTDDDLDTLEIKGFIWDNNFAPLRSFEALDN